MTKTHTHKGLFNRDSFGKSSSQVSSPNGLECLTQFPEGPTHGYSLFGSAFCVSPRVSISISPSLSLSLPVSLSIYIYLYIYIYYVLYVHLYIYIYVEREKDKDLFFISSYTISHIVIYYL